MVGDLTKRIVVAFLTLSFLLTSCAQTAGRSPTAVVDELFRFESPGGQVDFAYEPAARRRLFDLSGYAVANDGGRIALSDYAGRVVVVNFWASWCAACRDEAADLNAVVHTFAGAPVQFIGVNMDGDREDAAEFAIEFGLDYPSIFDPSSRLIRAIKGFPTATIPHTIVLDKQGLVAFVFLGNVSKTTLSDAVASLVS